jgi:hypothetical protein
MNPQTRQNLPVSNCSSLKKVALPFDTAEAYDKFHQDLRSGEVVHKINNKKNSYAAGWITRPTKRIDRGA